MLKIIKDEKNTYELKVDSSRGIVYEKFNDFLDIESLHNDYVTEVHPLLKGKKWTKCSDMTKYKVSNIGNIGNKHIEWCTRNGMVQGIIIVESSIVKMQMKRASNANKVNPEICTSLQEAEQWLKKQGF